MPKVKKTVTDKPRGRTTAYAFFIQTCHRNIKKTQPKERINFKEFARACATKWKAMTDNEKQTFCEMERQDKKRYYEETKRYSELKNGKSGGKPTTPTPKRKRARSIVTRKSRPRKERLVKDPNVPLKPLTSFFWYSNWERVKVKEEHPNFSLTDITRELGHLWSVMDPKTKRIYQEIAERDQLRYKKEMAEYKKKNEEKQNQTKSQEENDEESKENSGEEEQKEDKETDDDDSDSDDTEEEEKEKDAGK